MVDVQVLDQLCIPHYDIPPILHIAGFNLPISHFVKGFCYCIYSFLLLSLSGLYKIS